MDEIAAEIAMGEEAARLLQSPIGQYLEGCADQEVMAAARELVDTDSKDEKKISELKLRIALGTKFKDWLIERINRAVEARTLLEQSKTE